MPDICMCKGEGCTQKSLCYRHTAEPSKRQSYFAIVPLDQYGGCEHYAPNAEHRRILAEQSAKRILER